MVTVSFFAVLRERVGTSSIRFELNQIATTGELFESLAEKYPVLEDFRGTLLISVNEHYAGWDAPIDSGDAIALFPPVSGGTL